MAGVPVADADLETAVTVIQSAGIAVKKTPVQKPRVFLAEPKVVFLDEASSALDEASEARFYRMLREAPWQPTVVSVGHRGTLKALHEHVLDLTGLSRLRTRAAPAAG